MEQYDVPGTRNIIFRGGCIVAIGLGGMLLWAAFAPLDSGVNVPGIVIVTENRKAVQPLTSGKIIRLHVRDGQAVRQGETLIELDSRPLLALRENLHYQYLDALANLGRLQAEINDATSLSAFIDKRLSLDDSVAQALSQAQQKLLTSRRDAHLREGNAIQASIAGIAAQIAGARATIASNQQQVQLLNKQLLRVRPLVQEQFVAANRHLELERQFAQVSGALAQERQRLMALQQQKQEIEQTFSLRESEYRKMLYEQFIETSKLTQDLEQRLKSAEYDLENTKIISPASGIIVGLTVYTEGAIISAGQLLMEVVPQGQPLQINAQLPINLIDKIALHNPVTLSFTAFNQATTPRVSGRVILVGADQQKDIQTGQPYYDLQIRVDEHGSEALSHFDIRPGMPVEAFIRTGERSFLSYLFKPLFDRLKLAFTEE